MNKYVRNLFSIAMPVCFLLYGLSFLHSLLAWSGLTLILLIYLMMVWVHHSWWTRAKYALCAGLVIGLTLIISQFSGVNVASDGLLSPLVLLLAKEQQHYRRFTTLLAIMAIVAMFIISPTYVFASMWLPWVISLYVCVRAINIYKVAYRLSQFRVLELDEAHRELQQVHEALQEASVHSLYYAALTERARLARDMHDGLGHQLTALIVQLQALEIMLPDDPIRAAKTVPTMLEIVRNAMSEVRQVVRTWSEDECGLGVVALKGWASQCAVRSRLACEFQQDDELSDWPMEMSVVLYRVLQEAFTNIMRHAKATSVCVQVQECDHQVILTISDNGCYTADTQLLPGFGLKGVIERCQALGGSCTLSQNQPHGLKVQVRLPNKQSAQREVALKRIPSCSECALPSISL